MTARGDGRLTIPGGEGCIELRTCAAFQKDIAERMETAMTQTHTFPATELALKALAEGGQAQ